MKLIILLLLPVMLAAQQYVIPPTTTGNSGKYESKLIPITASRTYTWTWGTQGAVHAVLKARTVFQQDTSGYVVLDSVYSPSGFVAFTVSISGDSLMNVWLPDDAGGLGAPGADLKTRQGWQVKLIVETQSAGNGGKITVAEKSITAYTPPSVAYDDSSRYVKYVDSNRVQHGFVTMSKLYAYVLAQAAGVTTGVLTDTLNKFDRAVMGDSTARNQVLQKSFARSGGTFDTNLIAGRHHNFTYAQRFTQPYLTGSGLYVPIWTQLQDSVAAIWGFALGNYAWTNGPTGSTNYIDQVGGWQYNPNQADATQPNFGFSQESKYYVSSAWHSELHQVFNGVGAQLGVRPYTWIGRWGDGRVTSTSVNADRIQFGNGGGSNSGTADSTALDIAPPGFGSPGGVRIQNAYLDFDYAVSLADIARAQSDTAGVARKLILGWSGGVVTLGAAGGASDGYRVKGAKIAAGTAAVDVSRLTGRVTMSGASVRLPRGPWTSLAADSLEAATQGYVDTKIAGLTFVTSAALTDSLNANPRRDNGKLNITALTDTLSANVTRGATIKADTASLAVIADKMYPRTAGGSVGDSLRNRLFVRDTVTNTDSLKWCVREIRKAEYRHGVGYGGEWRRAEVEFDIEIPNKTYPTPDIVQMLLYSDSANNVQIAGWDYTVRNVYLDTAPFYGRSFGACGFEGSVSAWENSTTTQPASGRVVGIYGATMGTFYRVRMYAGAITGTASTGGRARVVVAVFMPPGSDSDWYVRLKNYP